MLGRLVVSRPAMLLLGLFVAAAAPPLWLIWTVWNEDADASRQEGPLLHDYVFDSAREATATIDDKGFVWPSLCAECDTALLRMVVRATLRGQIDQPWMDISLDGQFFARQYFPLGAVGEHMVNLSPLLVRLRLGGHQVQLEGHALEWEPQSAFLWQFTNRSLAGARVVVIAPHPEDAEMAAFGLYSEHASHVVTLTAGDGDGAPYARYTNDAAGAAELRTRLRVWDSRVVPWLGNVPPDRAVNLGFFEGTLAEMYEQPDATARSATLGAVEPASLRGGGMSPLLREGPVSASWGDLVDDLEHVVSLVGPDLIIAPHPMLDTDPDHQFATVALMEALARRDWNDLSLYLYSSHPPGGDRYPSGWADGLLSVPPTPGRPVSAVGLYSFPLDAETHALKLFALDALHSVRRPPPQRVREPLIEAMGDALRDAVYGRGVRVGGNAYRRAARPNELFLVYDVPSAADLVKSFLRHRG